MCGEQVGKVSGKEGCFSAATQRLCSDSQTSAFWSFPHWGWVPGHFTLHGILASSDPPHPPLLLLSFDSPLSFCPTSPPRSLGTSNSSHFVMQNHETFSSPYFSIQLPGKASTENNGLLTRATFLRMWLFRNPRLFLRCDWSQDNILTCSRIWWSHCTGATCVHLLFFRWRYLREMSQELLLTERKDRNSSWCFSFSKSKRRD